MYSHDENSEPSTRRGKRRSSILKIPKSPGYALDDIDPNTEDVDENNQKSKKARRSSSRRVSFAEKCQIKEIPNKVLEKMNRDEFGINEDNPVPPSFLNLESTLDSSVYRQPASTLAGLPSLLTSPIQESPDTPRFSQFSSDHRGSNQLDFTYCQAGNDIQDNENKTEDTMEMTRNYEGWEFEHSTVLTRQVVASKVAIPNQGQMPRASFVNELEPNNSFERRDSYDAVQSLKTSQSPKRNGASFLKELKTNSNPGFQSQQPKDKFNNNSFTMEAMHSTTFAMMSTFSRSVQSPVKDGISFLRNLEANTTCNRSSLLPQQKDEDLEITCGGAGNIDDSQFEMVDEDITVNMEMTRSYENWQLKMNPVQSKTPRNDSSFHFVKKASPERDDSCSEIPPYHGRIEMPEEPGDDVEESEMEMTRNYGNSLPKKDSNAGVVNKCSPEKEGLDFTLCQPGSNVEPSKWQDVDEDVTADQMEMTGNYGNWEQEKSNVLSMQPETLRNAGHFVQVSGDSTASHHADTLDHTASDTFDAGRGADVPKNQDSSLPIVNTSKPSEIQDASLPMVNTSKPSEIQESLPMMNTSKPSEIQESLPMMNTSKPSEIQESLPMVNTSRCETENEVCIPKVARREDFSENQTSNLSTCIEASESQTSMLDCKKPLDSSEDEKNPVKAIPRATSSKIIMDKNFERFEIKIPTSRIGKFSVFKSEEKSLGIKSDEKPPGFKSEEELSRPDLDSQEPRSCPQDLAITSTCEQLSNDDDGRSEKELGDHPNDTTASENIEKTNVSKCKNETFPEAKPTETPKTYTLKEFMTDAGISFLQYKTRRSETPMLKCDVPKELKDKIFSRCLSEAKLQIMEDFASQLEQEIIENEKLFAAKEKELDESNPPVFAKLKNVLGTESEDLVVDVIKQLKRTGDIRGKRLWYKKKTQMNTNILASLQEQEKKLFSGLTLLSNHKSELDEDNNMLNKLEADCDKQIEELERTLPSEEKEWAEFVVDTDELKQKLENLESELKSKEEQRSSLSSVQEALSSEIEERKKKTTDIQSAVEKLGKEKALRESKDEEMKKLLPFQTALQEWVLEKYDKTEFKFTFLGKTLDLDVTFADEEKVTDIQLISQISETSIPLAILGHSLVMEKFAHYDFIAMFPTRKKLRQLLHQVSLACVRVRILLQTMSDFSINHIVYVNGKILTVEFSSLAKFLKFVVNFDLSDLVSDGSTPFTVVRKIGNTSAEAITEELNKFPPTVIYFSKILEAADQLTR